MYSQEIRDFVLCLENIANLSYITRKSPLLAQQLKEETNFLPSSATLRERIYYVKNNTTTPPKCQVCPNYVKWEASTRTFRKFCSMEHYCRGNLDSRNKYKETMLERYGATHPSKSKELYEVRNKVMKEKYGVKHAMRSEKIKEKYRNAMIDRWGVLYPFQSEEIRARMRATMVARYGVEYAMQNPESFQKNQALGLRYKIYYTPGNKILYYQGYENIVLDFLIHEKNIKEDNIKMGNDIQPIRYYYNERQCSYYPDIYIPCLNWIIEVKSPFTYLKDKCRNEAKSAATKTMGFLINFFICKNKEIVEVL